MSAARERVLEAAWGLLTERGASAMSMDDVIEAAGVAKQTLYNHFPTKDRLISATLAVGAERFQRALVEAVRAEADEPAERLVAAFGVAWRMMAAGGFPGCTFVGAAVEDRGEGGEASELVRLHKAAVRGLFEGWAEAAGLGEPGVVAARLMVLLNGALMTSLIERDGAAFEHAAAMARGVVDDARSSRETGGRGGRRARRR
ncbi:MAG: TetR/AcrR family transcriptional regulator [Planctomycetota bacterium]